MSKLMIKSLFFAVIGGAVAILILIFRRNKIEQLKALQKREQEEAEIRMQKAWNQVLEAKQPVLSIIRVPAEVTERK